MKNPPIKYRCPFCDGESMFMMQTRINGLRNHLVCGGCGGTGPLGKTEEEAISLWNEQGANIHHNATQIIAEILKPFIGRVNDEALREEIVAAIEEKLVAGKKLDQ